MKYLVWLFVLSSISCTPFSKFAKRNEIGSCGFNPAYVCISNDSLDLVYQSFGGFKFASNRQSYRNLHPKKSPFENIVLYGKSNHLQGDYYLLLNNKNYPYTYFYKDTIIDKNKITIALSKSIRHSSNIDFLLNFKTDK